MAEYVTLAELKTSLEMAGETYADQDLSLAITAASAAVESMTGRRFDLDEEDVQRSYIPPRLDWIEIDDLVEVASIDADLYDEGAYTAWVEADYRLDPINGPADNVPWTSLRLTYNSAIPYFDPGCGMVRITGKWGWPAVPAGIKEATMILAARLTKRVREAPFGIAGMGADGLAVRVTRSDPDVAMLVSPFARTVRLA